MSLPGLRRSRSWTLPYIAVVTFTGGCSREPASSPPVPDAASLARTFDAGYSPPDVAAHPIAPPPSASAEASSPPPTVPEAQASGPCAASGLLVCDDFENMAVGMAPSGYALESGGGQPGEIIVTDQAAHSGRHSVYVNGNTFSSLFTKKGPPVFPQPSNSYYVRFFIRVGTEFTSGHSTFVEAGPDDLSNTNEIRLGFHVNQLEVNRMPGDAEQLSNGGDYNDSTTGVHFVPDTWHCLEILFDGAHDELRVWFEGTEVPALHVTDWKQGITGWSPTYASIRFGYEKYSGPSMEVWYDDVAIGTSQIGCGSGPA